MPERQVEAKWHPYCIALLNTLCHNGKTETEPTVGFNTETVKVKKLSLDIWVRCGSFQWCVGCGRSGNVPTHVEALLHGIPCLCCLLWLRLGCCICDRFYGCCAHGDGEAGNATASYQRPVESAISTQISWVGHCVACICKQTRRAECDAFFADRIGARLEGVILLPPVSSVAYWRITHTSWWNP